jgi:hypothetical protein
MPPPVHTVTSPREPTNAPAPAPAASPASAAKAKPRWRRYAPEALPNIVGYGLLALFALDLAQAMAAYRPFHAEDDQAMILQVLERIAVPLVAYVFVFWWDAPTENRFELRIRKLLSIAALPMAIGCAGLAIMAVHSGFRLFARAAEAIEQQDTDRIAALQRLAKDLAVMSPPAVQNTYQELVRRGLGKPPATPLATEDMRQQIAAAVPLAIDASHATSAQAIAQTRTLQLLVSGKYFLGGVIAAVLFFLIWDTTAAASDASARAGRRS